MTTYLFPGYVADVVALTGRIEANWGNAIRDRCLQVFSTLASLTAGVAAPQVGMVGVVTADGNNTGTYMYYGGAWTKIVDGPGAWETYTPTLAGFAVGNGSVSGSYWQSGKLLVVRADFVAGTTSTFGATPSLTIPAGKTWSSARKVSGSAVATDDSTGVAYASACFAPGNTTLRPRTGADGSANYSSTAPFTWANLDEMHLTAVGEIT